ncbi:MAG: PPOX class F420-dependent oxidoreductase [Actinomycetes bacterium]|nr:PPOX class F420-dependent oxidoreductase [Acidimicrobiia bacterium]
MDLSTALEFARPRHRGVLLAIQPNGMPHASNVVYAVIDDALCVSVTDSRAKTRHVRRDPRAAMYVLGDDFGQWLVVEGDVSLTPVVVDPDDDTARLLRRVYEAIAGPHPDWDEFDRAMIDDRRLVLTIHPTRAYGHI